MAEVYPWQAALWQQLASRKQHAHAYLLHGPVGIGKRALAERLRALLLCQAPVGLAPCGQCKGCHLLAAGTHPDSFVLEPEEVDKAIRVDQVRELVSFVVQTAQLGGRKVVLLEPVEAMNLNAANALLKSLGRALRRYGSAAGQPSAQSAVADGQESLRAASLPTAECH